MSLYVNGMNMPKNCMVCDFFEQFTSRGFFSPLGYCMRTGEEINVIARGLDCPLIELPPHGRLGDLDALAAQCDDPYWCVWLSDIDRAPTIIPAEEVQECSEN